MVKQFISTAKAGGGSDSEDMGGGLQSALNYNWTSNTRFVILIADAPCHGEQYPRRGLRPGPAREHLEGPGRRKRGNNRRVKAMAPLKGELSRRLAAGTEGLPLRPSATSPCRGDYQEKSK